MKKYKKSTVISYITTIALTIICCFCSITTFNNLYFDIIFVDGNSMAPTLRGKVGEDNGCDFGYVDTHELRKNKIKRFDIITCYYPFLNTDYSQPFIPQTNQEVLSSATSKIKRVIGLPGETIKLVNNELFVLDENNDFQPIEFTYSRNLENDYTKSFSEITLKENEYWVMGDNWARGESFDCATYLGFYPAGPIYYENIIGVLVSLNGICTVNVDGENNFKLINKQYYFPRYDF